jgi:hypothetical protein
METILDIEIKEGIVEGQWFNSWQDNFNLQKFNEQSKYGV